MPEPIVISYSMTTPIYYIKNGELTFGDKVLFNAVELYVYPNDKICLIGRNGSGKSSLLKIMQGEYDLSSGEVYAAPNIKISYLTQNYKVSKHQTIYQFILGPENIDEKYKADIILSELEIDGNKNIAELSGGQFRRACLAKSLIDSPELLLLDEPTNHLDIKLIEWLEEFIKSYSGAIVCISHDRSFLSNVTNKVWWLDKGIVRKSDKGFKHFETWQEEVIEEETKTLQKLSKKLQVEDDWLTYGVSARRKRNQKRLAGLLELREKLRNQQISATNAKQKIQASIDETKKTQFIIEADGICFDYNSQLEQKSSSQIKPLITNFNIRVKKGEKIGIVGPNGTGKTTLLKILTKQLLPTSGKIKHGTDLDISYLDQTRNNLVMDQTLQEILCPGGGCYVEIAGKTMHVASYLKQFLFDPRLLSAKVSILSGGEGNRLLLAKTLIKPGNLLILDEPTNDLDMDTIEILLEILSEYTGTCIIVSHDRDFLNRLVNRTLVFEDNGNILEVCGGYDDYEKFYKKPQVEVKKLSIEKEIKTKNTIMHRPGKISYKYQRELELLPKEISVLEKEISDIESSLSDDNLFLSDPGKFNLLTNKLNYDRVKLEEKIARWIEIDCLINDA
jgi:ATP-binding cassette subfamily F protein uup